MKNEGKIKEAKNQNMRENLKIKRQLLIFHLYRLNMKLSYEVTVEFFMEVAPQKEFHLQSRRTFERDIQELKEAGAFKNSRQFSKNKARNIHLNKLFRLTTIMREEPNVGETGESISNWYKQRFPNSSSRTMYRDFSILKSIGYKIIYYRFENIYEIYFPYDYYVNVK